MLRDCTTCGNCTWGNGLGPFPEICIKCRYVEEDGCKVPSNWKAKPKTNADRIRAMTDEELATFLESFGCCHYCTEHERLGNEARFLQEEKCDEQCEKHLLEWLQQLAEGDCV